MQSRFKILAIFLVISSIILYEEIALGVVFIDVQGSGANTHLEFQQRKSYSTSCSVAFGLGSYVRLGLRHLRQYLRQEGYRTYHSAKYNTTFFYEFIDSSKIIYNSLELTIVLYNGMVSPYIFGGTGMRHTYTTTQQLGTTTKHRPSKDRDIVHYGIGASIMLDRNFRLKISQRYAPIKGVFFEGGQRVEKEVLDSEVQIGISYQIR